MPPNFVGRHNVPHVVSRHFTALLRQNRQTLVPGLDMFSDIDTYSIDYYYCYILKIKGDIESTI